MNLKVKKVFISGVTGMDGSLMADYLLANTNYEIYGGMRRLSNDNHVNIHHLKGNPRFKLVYFDLSDGQNVSEVIADIKPDYFINLAAQSFVGASWSLPKQTFEVDATAIIDILEAVRKFNPKCRVYQAGSSEEFGDVKYSPQDEKHPLCPRSPYGAAKAASRHIVKVWRESYGLYVVQGFLFNHENSRRGVEFLPKKVSMGVARIYAAMIKGKSFEPLKVGNMSSKRDWSEAEDFIAGIWAMLNQEVTNMNLKAEWDALPYPQRTEKWLSSRIKEYVLSSDETHLVAELIEKAFDAANIDAELRFEKDGDWSTAKFYVRGTDIVLVEVDPQFFRPAEVDLLWGDSSKARNELGWTPKTTFEELIKKMVYTDINK